jgi:hypothetical protein
MPEEFSSAITQAFDSAAGAFASLTSSLPAGFLADVFTIFIGSFLGAGLAIFFATRKQDTIRRRDQKAAGNLAIATLARLANDFALARAVILNYRELILREQPRLPLWMHIKPAHFSHATALRFDLPSLIFLFEYEGGSHLVQKLITAESAYHEFFGQLRAYSGIAEAIREKFSTAEVNPMDDARVRELADAAGPANVARAEELTHAILAHVERSERVFRELSVSLPGLLSRKFGKKGIGTIEIPTYTQLRKSLELSEDGLQIPPIRP